MQRILFSFNTDQNFRLALTTVIAAVYLSGSFGPFLLRQHDPPSEHTAIDLMAAPSPGCSVFTIRLCLYQPLAKAKVSLMNGGEYILLFHKHVKYRRQEIWNIVKGKDEKISRNFQQSGYERVDDNLFAFVNIGYKGHAGQIFPNQYDPKTERLLWYGKKETHSNQPLMKRLIDGNLRFHCFGRWSDEPNFTFLGIGKLVSYRDNFTDVFNKDGTQTFCLEVEFDLSDSSIHPAWINNFDAFYEGDPPDTTEGKEKYVRHKTRERDPAIVKAKKDQFQKEHGRLFCEACDFDFKNTYGKRGEGFIECHHNIPLHSIEGETQTKISDLTLLCSNCHRIVHRKKDWLTLQQLKKLLVSP